MPALSVSATKLNEAMAVAVKYGMPHIGLEAGESATLTQADLTMISPRTPGIHTFVPG